MFTVTFIVVKKSSPDKRFPFTVLRLSENRQDVVSYHRTQDEAAEAATRYARQARFSGLDAVMRPLDWIVEGTRAVSSAA